MLRNSKDLLINLEDPSVTHVSSIRTFDFSTLHTTIPHTELKERLHSLVMKAFFSEKYDGVIITLRTIYGDP